MAVEYISWAFKTKLPTGLKFTLVAICDFVDQNGEWSIKHDTLAEKTGHSRRTIVNHVEQLCKIGVLTVEHTRRTDGRQGANRYRVNQLHSGEIQSATDAFQSATDDAPECNQRQIQSATTSHHLPSDSYRPLPSTTVNRARATPDAGFDALWQAWQPFDMRKGNRGKALEAWGKHVRKAGLDPGRVVEQARAYCAACRRLQTKTQHVVTWLNQKGWEDDYGPPMSNSEMVHAALREKYRRQDEADASKQAGNSRDGHPALGGGIPPAQIAGTGAGGLRRIRGPDGDDDLRGAAQPDDAEGGDGAVPQSVGSSALAGRG